MKITLEEIAPYLPYGLYFACIDPDSGEWTDNGVQELNFANETIKVGSIEYDFSDIGGPELKPILRPLSDIDPGIFNDEEEDYIARIASGHTYYYGSLSYVTVQYLLKNHYDFQNLIMKGLAIHINTIQK